MAGSPKFNSALGFIFLTILIDVTGMGIIMPITPKLLAEMTHSGISQASTYGGWLTFSYSIVQFVFAPVLGNLSDRYGRRPVLLLALLGFGLNYLFLAFAPTITWFFVGRILAGVTGASFTAASAYIADISIPEKRAQNFGIIGAAFGLGFIIGPVLGGFLGQYNIRLPFIVSAVLCLLNFIYGFFFLPESLSKDHRRPFELKRANPLGSLKQLRKYPAFSGMILALTLVYIAGHAVQSTWAYFVMERFNWKESMVGYSIGTIGLMTIIVQGGLIRVIIPKIGQKNGIISGLALYSISFILFAFASQSWMIFLFITPYALAGITGPAIQGLISTQVPANEQGELQGGLTGLMSATAVVGPPLMTTSFAHFTASHTHNYFPGAPFILGAALTVVSTILAFRSLNALPENT